MKSAALSEERLRQEEEERLRQEEERIRQEEEARRQADADLGDIAIDIGDAVLQGLSDDMSVWIPKKLVLKWSLFGTRNASLQPLQPLKKKIETLWISFPSKMIGHSGGSISMLVCR